MTTDILSRLAELGPALKDESSKRKLDEICEAVKALGLSDGSRVVVPVESIQLLQKFAKQYQSEIADLRRRLGIPEIVFDRSAQETKDA